MPEYDVFTLDAHCHVCHQQTTHEVQYKIDRRSVFILVQCGVCRTASKCTLSIRTLAYATIKWQWGMQ